jgi:uncharacterized lipoprotein YehR (DUF1307 family)
MDVYTNLGSWTKERFRKVYQRTMKIYKGVDNRLDFQVRNNDNKAKNITELDSVTFNIIAVDTKGIQLQKAVTIETATEGKMYVLLSEADIQDLERGYYQFSMFYTDGDGNRFPLYGDSQYDALGQLHVIDGAFDIDSTTQI